MDTLKRKVIVIAIGLTALGICTIAYGQRTKVKPEISNQQLIKELQAQVEQLQAIIKTQEVEIQRLKEVCKKAGIESKPTEKQPKREGKILEFYQKYKNKYAFLDGEYIFLSAFLPKDSNSPISKWAVGEYGRSGSMTGFKIFQILGPDEMFIEYYDSFFQTQTKLARFKGWLTKNLIDGQYCQYWRVNVNEDEKDEPSYSYGTEIAIVGTYRYTTAFGTIKTVLDVVPVELFRKGITLEQFKEVLKTKADLPKDLQELKADILR